MNSGMQVFNQSGQLIFDSNLHDILTARQSVTFKRSDLYSSGGYMWLNVANLNKNHICLPIGYGANNGVITATVFQNKLRFTTSDYNQRMGDFTYTANIVAKGAD